MRRIALLLLLVAATGCRRNVEVEKALAITDVHTGWYDAGLQPDGKNKLVPSLSMRLKNVSSDRVSSVQLVAIFRRINEPEVAWGEHFVRAIGPNGIGPGESTNPIVLRSNLGYTGTESRLQLLQHKGFVDARVDIFGRHGSRNLTKMSEQKIDRQLLTQ